MLGEVRSCYFRLFQVVRLAVLGQVRSGYVGLSYVMCDYSISGQDSKILRQVRHVYFSLGQARSG